MGYQKFPGQSLSRTDDSRTVTFPDKTFPGQSGVLLPKINKNYKNCLTFDKLFQGIIMQARWCTFWPTLHISEMLASPVNSTPG